MRIEEITAYRILDRQWPGLPAPRSSLTSFTVFPRAPMGEPDLPEDPSEVLALDPLPYEQVGRKVVIAQECKAANTSGPHGIHQWHITFKNQVRLARITRSPWTSGSLFTPWSSQSRIIGRDTVVPGSSFSFLSVLWPPKWSLYRAVASPGVLDCYPRETTNRSRTRDDWFILLPHVVSTCQRCATRGFRSAGPTP